MTPADAERLIHRRVRALAEARSPESTSVEVSIVLNPSDAVRGQWCASAYGTTKVGAVVKVAAHDPDPTAALLALPGAVAAEIDALIEDLRRGLREGVDMPEEEEAPALAVLPATRPKRTPRRAPATPDDGQLQCVNCGAPVGARHLSTCPQGVAR